MNKRTPKISIIIPVYNTEEYLRECLDSVIEQTLKDIEIILVDDGSTDNSGKICDEYREKDTRITVIHQENRGQGKARNEALKISNGEYIGFIDSDDWIDLDFYEKLYNAASEKESEVTVARIKEFYDKKGFVDAYNNLNDLSIIFKDIVCDSIFKKDFLDKYKIFFPEGIIFEDIVFTLKVNSFVKKRFFYVDSFYYYRKNRKTSTMNTFQRNYDANLKLKASKECKNFLNSLVNTQYYINTELLFCARELYLFSGIIDNDKSFFNYIKNEIKKIDFANNKYVPTYLKHKCNIIINSNFHWQFFIRWKIHKKINPLKIKLKKIKGNIIYFIYLVLLKLGIKDIVKKLLQKLGYKFDE